MSKSPATAQSPETQALGNYAIRRTHRTARFKSRFTRHMLEKRKRRFNPFEHLPRRPKARIPATPDTGKAPKDTSELGKLQKITKEAQDIMISVKSVFPFMLFPDIITVDRHKLTIVYRTFFRIEQSVSVALQDIKNIQADMGPFFGSLTITSDHFINSTQEIGYLWRFDAKRIQELVQGAMVANHEAIDLTQVATKKLTDLLIDLGKGHSGVTA